MLSLLCSKSKFGSVMVRRYATSRKIAGSRSDEMIFFTIYLILPATLGPGVYSAFNRKILKAEK
jgi:hypothetical protein